MKNKKSKSKQKVHVTYNRKVFLAPNSIRSMSAIHAKIKEDGTAIFRLSDCNNSIRWWNDLNNQEEVLEMVEKLDNAMKELALFREQVIIKSQKVIL